MRLEVLPADQSVFTPSAPSGRACRVVFSFPVVLGALLVLLMMFTVRSRFSDPDLWWHLKIGQVIWNTHAIPRVDLFSFTAYGHPWIAQEWLSETLIYGAYKLGGYSGLMLWLCVTSSLLALGAFLLCTLYSGNCKVAFLGAIVTWLFSTIGLSLRPHMIGYLLLVCELLILHLGRSRNSRWFLTLPPLFALWINCHGSFPFGLAVLGVALLCSCFEFEFGSLVSHRRPRQERKMLAIALSLSAMALFINPLGLKPIWYPFDVLLSQPVNLSSVSEWQPPGFATGRGLGLVVVAGLVLLIPLLRRLDITLEELILVALGFGMGMRHERMVFVFGILAAPILCRLLATAWEGYDPQRDRILPNAVTLAVLATAIVLVFPSAPALAQQVEQANPVKAVRFIQQSGLSGRMLNEHVYGGYLIWAAPEHKVFIDGRGDVFEWTGVFREYQDWTGLQADPQLLLDKYQISLCLLSRHNAMIRVLRLLPGWKQVYSDDLAVVFVKQP
jgi:hypothetical protein